MRGSERRWLLYQTTLERRKTRPPTARELAQIERKKARELIRRKALREKQKVQRKWEQQADMLIRGYHDIHPDNYWAREAYEIMLTNSTRWSEVRKFYLRKLKIKLTSF